MHILLSVCLFFLTSLAIAQEDYLLMKNGDMFWIKTVSKKGKYIVYTMNDEHNNTFHFADKKDVRRIVKAKKFENANRRIENKEKRKHTDSALADYGKNFLGLDLYPLRFNTVQLNYTHVFSHCHAGLSSFLSVNTKPSKFYADYGRTPPTGYSWNKNYPEYFIASAGSELRFYQNFRRSLCFHYGPGLSFSLTSYARLKPELKGSAEVSAYLINGAAPQDEWLDKYKSGFFASGTMNAGFLWRPAKNIFADLNVGASAGDWIIRSSSNTLKADFCGSLVVGWNF